MSNIKENTIRSVVFSSPFDFNHRLNRMRYFGAVTLLIFVRGVINLAAYKSGNGEFQALVTLLLMPLYLIDCKIMFARFSEFLSNKNIIITLLGFMIIPLFWMDSVASVGWTITDETVYYPVALIIMVIVLLVSFISTVALFFTPASKPEETVVAVA